MTSPAAGPERWSHVTRPSAAQVLQENVAEGKIDMEGYLNLVRESVEREQAVAVALKKAGACASRGGGSDRTRGKARVRGRHCGAAESPTSPPGKLEDTKRVARRVAVMKKEIATAEAAQQKEGGQGAG